MHTTEFSLEELQSQKRHAVKAKDYMKAHKIYRQIKTIEVEEMEAHGTISCVQKKVS